jgi:alkylhydroperoxidase family enzyme
VLRSYARFRSELRNGSLSYATQQRIALAVAEHQGSEYAISTLCRTGRDAGLGMDEIALAREFDSYDEREAALLRFVKALLESDGPPKLHLLEEAREAGWDDEQILEAIAHVALATYGNLITRAGDVPKDGSSEDSRFAKAA